MAPDTRQRLLEEGLGLLLAHGYNHLGIQTLLARTGVPKGSFYHHFESKEDFAFQVIDRYMEEVHAGLDACLADEDRAPLARVRHFFELSREKYRGEGYLGCLLGGLGQELSGISDRFRHRIDACLSQIAGRITTCLDEARARGELPADADCPALANLLVDCWEGAALRSRLWRDPAPLDTVLDFYFSAVAERTGTGSTGAPVHPGKQSAR